MRSSTSNFKSGSRARKTGHVLILLFVLLFGLEIFTRVKLFKMSKDFVRFYGYAKKAATLNEMPGMRIAFIGNSSTERGLNIPLFKEALRQHHGPAVNAEMFVADSSKINTWHYMINSYFWRPNLHPDLVVITYYERNLEDGNKMEIGRLAQFFTTRDDWSDIFSVDLPNPSDRMEFVLSSYWATFAARERINERVLGAITPDYKNFLTMVNDVNYRQQQAVHPVVPTPQVKTYRALRRLLARARQQGTRICFVSIPTQEPGQTHVYDLDEETIRLIREAGMDFVDMRHTPGITPDRFADDIHLTPEGAAIYSRELAAKMQAVLQRDRTISAR